MPFELQIGKAPISQGTFCDIIDFWVLRPRAGSYYSVCLIILTGKPILVSKLFGIDVVNLRSYVYTTLQMSF